MVNSIQNKGQSRNGYEEGNTTVDMLRIEHMLMPVSFFLPVLLLSLIHAYERALLFLV
jgi:hypothetical protein